MADATTYNDNVFINCPFDPPYARMFEALIFAIYFLGFRARTARELDDGADGRMEKITRIISECRYGIHDISKADLDADTHLARFNMPLELGVFLGARRFGDDEQKKKMVMVLDVEQFRYREFISDLAGADIHAHHGDPVQAVREVRDWLRNASRRKLASANTVAEQYARFITDLPVIADRENFDVDRIPYVDFEWIVTTWLTA